GRQRSDSHAAPRVNCHQALGGKPDSQARRTMLQVDPAAALEFTAEDALAQIVVGVILTGGETPDRQHQRSHCAFLPGRIFKASWIFYLRYCILLPGPSTRARGA